MHVEWIEQVPLWLPHVDRVGWTGNNGTGALMFEPSFDLPTIRHPNVSYETFEAVRPKLEDYHTTTESPEDILGDIFRSTPTVTEDQSPWVRSVNLTCYNCGAHGFKEMVTPSGYVCDDCETFVPYGSAERDACGHEVPGVWLEIGQQCPKCNLTAP